MNVIDFSVKNTLFVNLLSVFILLGGVFALWRLQREVFPDVKFDEVSVVTLMPGAPADDVEKLLTIPIEEELRGVSGVKRIDSSSVESVSSISVTIDPKATDKKRVVDDLRNAVDRVDNLPEESEDPQVTELETKIMPVLDIYIGGDVPEEVLREYAEQLEDLLLDLDGVARVGHIGWRDREVWVEVDPLKMQEWHVSFDEVAAALQSRNITLPGGIVRNSEDEFNVRVTGEFYTPQEIMDVIVRANDAGNWVRVRDVARVRAAFEDRVTRSRLNGKEALGLRIFKKEKRDVLRTVGQIKQTVSGFQKLLRHDIQVQLVDDMSFYVKRRLGVLTNNALMGFFLVLIALFIFLEPVPAVMTALGIPMSLFMTFAAMNLLGITVNVVSMIGFIIVLGMLVDDGIVITENVYRYVQRGIPVLQAVREGASEVSLGVVASIVTTWASFIPLLLMTDLTGKFVVSIPIIVIIALAASMFEAFVILPAHLAVFMKSGAALRPERRWLLALQERYSVFVRRLLEARYWVMLFLLGLTILTGVLVTRFIKVVFFVSDGVEELTVMAEARRGISLDKIFALTGQVEDLLLREAREEIKDFTTSVGEVEGERRSSSSRTGTHLAQVKVFLTPFQQRKATAKQIAERLRPELEKLRQAIPELDKLYIDVPQMGPPTGKPVQIGVRGEKYEIINRIAAQLKTELVAMPGVSDVRDDYDFGKQQIEVQIDEAAARQAYLTIGQIASSVRAAFYGRLATTIKPEKADKEIDVLVRFPEDVRSDREAFSRILVANTRGDLVPLTAVAKIADKEGINSIGHYNGKRVVYVSAQVDDDKATSLTVNRALQQKFAGLSKDNPGYSLYFGGQHQENMESLMNLGVSALLAAFLIFIILAASFGSVIQPFTIMLSIPFGFMGVIIAFFLHGMPLSFFAFVGMIGLAGVVVNSSIIMIEFINMLRQRGLSRMESLVEAGRLRLRPILMTSITTVAGLTTIAYNFGGGDPFIRPMAMALVWGLVSSTFLTLLVTPCIYAVLDDFSLRFLHHATVKVNPKAEAVS